MLFPKPGPILPDLDRRGIRYRIWGPLCEYTDPFSYAKAVARTWRFLQREKVAVLHINHSGFWRAAEMVGAKLARVPILAHYHLVVDRPPPFTALLARVIAVSEFVSRASESSGVSKTVVYNAVELERFDTARDIRAELGIPAEATVVSFVGQIRGIKGIDLFIRLASEISGCERAFPHRRRMQRVEGVSGRLQPRPADVRDSQRSQDSLCWLS